MNTIKNNKRNSKALRNKVHNKYIEKIVDAQDIQEYFEQYNELFTELLNKLVAKLKTKTDDACNFVVFVAEAVKIISEEAMMLHGYQKKEMVIDLVKSVVETMDIDEVEKTKLRNFIFPSIDNTIDLFIAAAKGYLFLQKVEQDIDEGCAKCQASCSGGGCGGCKKTKNKAKKPVKTLHVLRDGEGGVYLEGLVDVVYGKLHTMITNKTITVSNVIAIVTLTMQLVQQYASLTGQEKKYIVIHVVTKLVNEIPMNEDDRFAVQAIVNTTLDKTIDYVVAVANGEIDLLGQIEETVGRCKAMCGCV